MMKKIKNSIILGLIALIFGGCTPKPLKVNLPQAETKLVVASQVVPNAGMVVAVSKSFSALDNTGKENGDTTNSGNSLDEYLDSGAEVTITYNGITEKLYGDTSLPGIYVNPFIPQLFDVEYTLKVFDPETGLRVQASAVMLPRVFFDTVYAVRGSGSDSEHVFLHYTISDPPDRPNWYMLNIYDAAQKDSTDGQGGPFSNGGKRNLTIAFSDAAFEGQTYNNVVNLYYWNTDSLVASVANISEDYYNYLNARERGGGIAASLFNDPVNYPTNVQGGYGFFTTHVPDIRLVVSEP